VTLEPGTLILCHRCHAAILEVVMPLKEGDMIMAAHFRFLPDGRPRDGDPMECAACGVRFHDFTTLSLPIQDSVQYTIGC
jgi:hypothetical protein